jgi:hypothetical protein
MMVCIRGWYTTFYAEAILLHLDIKTDLLGLSNQLVDSRATIGVLFLGLHVGTYVGYHSKPGNNIW